MECGVTNPETLSALKAEAREHRRAARRIHEAIRLLERPQRPVGRPRHGDSELLNLLEGAGLTYTSAAKLLAVHADTVSAVVRGISKSPELERRLRDLCESN